VKKPSNGMGLPKAFAVEFGSSWQRWAKRRTATELDEIEQRLSQLAVTFGKPHVHAGLGVRRLKENVFEFRISRGIRVIFLLFKPNRLHLVMTGNHDEARAWLKENA